MMSNEIKDIIDYCKLQGVPLKVQFVTITYQDGSTHNGDITFSLGYGVEHPMIAQDLEASDEFQSKSDSQPIRERTSSASDQQSRRLDKGKLGRKRRYSSAVFFYEISGLKNAVFRARGLPYFCQCRGGFGGATSCRPRAPARQQCRYHE